MATTSQKMMEMRFLVRMRGALTPAPRMDEPVMNIPLARNVSDGKRVPCCVAVYLG
jgi:hypothetical protein